MFDVVVGDHCGFYDFTKACGYDANYLRVTKLMGQNIPYEPPVWGTSKSLIRVVFESSDDLNSKADSLLKLKDIFRMRNIETSLRNMKWLNAENGKLEAELVHTVGVPLVLNFLVTQTCSRWSSWSQISKLSSTRRPSNFAPFTSSARTSYTSGRNRSRR